MYIFIGSARRPTSCYWSRQCVKIVNVQVSKRALFAQYVCIYFKCSVQCTPTCNIYPSVDVFVLNMTSYCKRSCVLYRLCIIKQLNSSCVPYLIHLSWCDRFRRSRVISMQCTHTQTHAHNYAIISLEMYEDVSTSFFLIHACTFKLCVFLINVGSFNYAHVKWDKGCCSHGNNTLLQMWSGGEAARLQRMVVTCIWREVRLINNTASLMCVWIKTRMFNSLAVKNQLWLSRMKSNLQSKCYAQLILMEMCILLIKYKSYALCNRALESFFVHFCKYHLYMKCNVFVLFKRCFLPAE